MTEWISVKDRLPDDTGTRYKVFVICKKKIETEDKTSPYFMQGIVGVYQDWNIRKWSENYTHWMPIPPLPKE